MSTRTVSTLNIQMHADTATASEQIRTFGDRAKSALDDVKKHAKTVAVGIGAGASAAAVAVASVTKEHITLANELQKTARIANTTASEIQKYTFAAKAMGIEQDKLGDIFKDTQDKVGDFLTTGGGEMMDFFENIAPQIGITAKEFRNLSGADALQLYYTSLEKANLSQSEMIFYMESVADEASLLIPLLANGGEGFKLWSDMAERAGAVMNEETLVATQKLTASTEIMNLMWQGAKNNFVSAVIPALSDVAGELIKNGETAQFAKQAGESLVITLKFMAKWGVGVASVFRTAGEYIGGLFAAWHNIATGLNFDSPISFLKSIADTAVSTFDIVKMTGGSMIDVWGQASEAMAKIDRLGTGATNSQVQAVMNLTTAQQKYNAQLGKTGSELAEQRKEAEKLAKEQEKITKTSTAPRVVGIVGDTGIGATHLDIRRADGKKPTQSDLDRFRADGKKLTDYRMTSGYGYRNINVQGASKFHKGLDFAIAKGTEITTTVPVASVKKWWDEKGGGWVSDVKFADGLVMKLLHQDPSMQHKVSTGASLGVSAKSVVSGAKPSYSYSQADIKAMQKIQSLVRGSELANIAQKHGVPVGLLEGLMMQESRGQQYAKSHTGALGYFQTTSGFRQQWGLSRDDSFDLIKSGTATVKSLALAFKEFGNWTDAIRSHNAGVAGTKKFNQTGKVSSSKARNDEVANYVPKIAKWSAWFGDSRLDGKSDNTGKEHLEFVEAQKVLEKDAQESARRQLAIARDYADKRKLIELDLQAEIDKIKQAGFDTDTESRYIAQAKQRADIELALFENAQAEKLQSMTEYRLTEEQAIIANFAKERQAIINNAEFALAENQQFRDELLRAIDEKERYELDKFRLTQDQKRLELDEANLSELARIKARYELERREMALSNHSLKDEMIAKSHKDEASEIGQLQKGHRDNTVGLLSDLTGNSNLLQVQQEYQARKQIIDEALANEAISFAEHHAMLGVLERTAYESRRQVITEGMQGVAGSLTQITGDLLGKQSKAYRVMFAVEKGFAIARSVMAIQTGIAQAAALPFPANFPAMASVISATASIISTLQSVRQPIGQAHDGIMSVPESGTWNLQKGERVLPQYTAKRLDKTLDNLQGGQGVQVVINNYTSANVEATTDDDGKLKILITNEINKQVPSQLANPNSPISKGLKNNWQVAPKR